MGEERLALYDALTARDARFDGIFFVGVTSTGIYCRPICPAKTPKETNCRFFDSPQQAEQEGFRPCLRCRPELAPGSAPVDDAQRIAQLLVQRLEEGAIHGEDRLEAVADQFELSSRQIRRIITRELGAPPIQLILTRRLLLAKQLLTDTRLPITEIAFASGFTSLRRFNDAFSARYGMPPTHLKKKAMAGLEVAANDDTSILQLSYRAPYDWSGMVRFLKMRELTGVEWVTDHFYARTVNLGGCQGWIKVTQASKRDGLLVEFANTLAPVLPALLSRVRGLFDLNARPDLINKHLGRDKILKPLVKATPGMRVPGAFDGFEAGLRAILGQQITVKAATTIACRVVEAYGKPIATPHAQLRYLTPCAARIARLPVKELAKHGIVRARCESILALAQAQAQGKLMLDGGIYHDPRAAIERLAEVRGIGQWTAHYMAMRAIRWPDAFPSCDRVVLKRLGRVSAQRAEQMSQPWRPWRAYAVLHLWRGME